MDKGYKLIHGDCFDAMYEIDDSSVDAIITDPPYGINLSSWDKGIDIPMFFKECKRVIKPDGFIAFFGQMPTLLEWCNNANQYFKWSSHISWVKRQVTPNHNLMRGHESIMIYRNGRAKFYKTKGKYTDVRVPGVMFDIVNIETIKRYISDLHYAIKHGNPRTFKQTYQRHDAYQHLKPRSGTAASEDVNFTNVWSFQPANTATYNKGGKEHPTGKPVDVIVRLIEMLSQENDVILDPFIGSGTTIIAGLKTNRKVIGVEKFRQYHDISQHRINEYLTEPKQHNLI